MTRSGAASVQTAIYFAPASLLRPPHPESAEVAFVVRVGRFECVFRNGRLVSEGAEGPEIFLSVREVAAAAAGHGISDLVGP